MPEIIQKRIKGFRLGADDFIPKPLPTSEIEPRVRRALEAPNKAYKSLVPTAP